MVFRGKPSKACKRCRERRLKCDFRVPSCGQCIRAGVGCSGYRDTQQLRIQDESHMIRLKAVDKQLPPTKVVSVDLSVTVRAREAFFLHYVTSTTRVWEFLKSFYDTTNQPELLKLSIDAVSFAYQFHQAGSDKMLMSARQKYARALQLTNKALRIPHLATQYTTLVACFLLDLFEKLANSKPHDGDSWTGHVNGSLALVGLRGVHTFRDESTLKFLVMLCTNCLISCVISATPVPKELVALRAYTEQQLGVVDPKWKLSSLMVEYANFRSVFRTGMLSVRDCLQTSLKLDSGFRSISVDMPESWQYVTSTVHLASERIFDQRYDLYPTRHTTQAWNVLRTTRIFLNQFLLEIYGAWSEKSEDNDTLEPSQIATTNIELLAGEICASVPQYICCKPLDHVEGIGHPGLEDAKKLNGICDRSGLTHGPSRNMDCYILLFPLYVIGRCPSVPEAQRDWVLKQLHYISDHFCIRQARTLAEMIEQKSDVDPWTAYAMLGSYAFAAC